MGVEASISTSEFPRQGSLLGKRVRVCFRYFAAHHVDGVCVRDDMEPPFQTILRLDDGRHVLGTECQYTTLPE